MGNYVGSEESPAIGSESNSVCEEGGDLVDMASIEVPERRKSRVKSDKSTVAVRSPTSNMAKSSGDQTETVKPPIATSSNESLNTKGKPKMASKIAGSLRSFGKSVRRKKIDNEGKEMTEKTTEEAKLHEKLSGQTQCVGNNKDCDNAPRCGKAKVPAQDQNEVNRKETKLRPKKGQVSVAGTDQPATPVKPQAKEVNVVYRPDKKCIANEAPKKCSNNLDLQLAKHGQVTVARHLQSEKLKSASSGCVTVNPSKIRGSPLPKSQESPLVPKPPVSPKLERRTRPPAVRANTHASQSSSSKGNGEVTTITLNIDEKSVSSIKREKSPWPGKGKSENKGGSQNKSVMPASEGGSQKKSVMPASEGGSQKKSVMPVSEQEESGPADTRSSPVTSTCSTPKRSNSPGSMYDYCEDVTSMSSNETPSEDAPEPTNKSANESSGQGLLGKFLIKVKPDQVSPAVVKLQEELKSLDKGVLEKCARKLFRMDGSATRENTEPELTDAAQVVSEATGEPAKNTAKSEVIVNGMRNQHQNEAKQAKQPQQDLYELPRKEKKKREKQNNAKRQTGPGVPQRLNLPEIKSPGVYLNSLNRWRREHLDKYWHRTSQPQENTRDPSSWIAAPPNYEKSQQPGLSGGKRSSSCGDGLPENPNPQDAAVRFKIRIPKAIQKLQIGGEDLAVGDMNDVAGDQS